MAKRTQNLDNIFAKTEPAQGGDLADLDAGRIRPTGVGLKEGEIAALDALGQELGGISRNALIRFAVRYLIAQTRAGEIDLGQYAQAPEKPKKSLKFYGK